MRSIVRAAAVLALAALFPAFAGAEHRLGFGYHYWQTIDDIESIDELDDAGSSIVLSYQYLPGGAIRFEGDFEYFDEGWAGVLDESYSPQVYVLLGRFLYGGVGVGITRADNLPSGDDWTDPWFAAKIGLDMLLLPRIHLDINANYRSGAFDDAFEGLQDADIDAMTFGASLRIAF